MDNESVSFPQGLRLKAASDRGRQKRHTWAKALPSNLGPRQIRSRCKVAVRAYGVVKRVASPVLFFGPGREPRGAQVSVRVAKPAFAPSRGDSISPASRHQVRRSPTVRRLSHLVFRDL